MLNKAEELKFQNFRGRCRKLGVAAPPDVFINLNVVDKDGRVVFDDKQRGHSFTRNFWNSRFSSLIGVLGTGTTWGAGQVNVRVTTGAVHGETSRSFAQQATTTHTDGANYYSPVGKTPGIVVGTSDAVFSADDHALGTRILHGTEADRFVYQLCDVPSWVYDDTLEAEKWVATITRVFNNNSGGSITVKETGLYNRCLPFVNSHEVIMMERSVLSPEVAVADGAQLTVTYEFVFDFSAID